VCGDGVCDPSEAATCPADCPVVCDHPVCDTGGPLGASCDSCTASVCAMDPFCCTGSWDGQCANEASGLCGACCGNGVCNNTEDCSACPADCCNTTSCAHSACFLGDKLDLGACHDPCVGVVCAQDASCCMGPNWNDGCQTLAKQLCPGPDPCIAAVCQQNPSCCTQSWTQACVTLATSLCQTQCDCAHSICVDGEKLAASCNPCAKSVCAADAYCCDTAWDGICVDEVVAICNIACQ
jgi:hypothetical protein